LIIASGDGKFFMRKQLTPSQYAAVAPLFAELDFNLVIRSVIAGNTPGWVFADRAAAPGVALIWDRADALLLAGENQDVMALAALRNLLHHIILPEARARGIPDMVLFTTSLWQGMLPTLLAGLAADPAGRRSYRYISNTAPDIAPLAPGFCVQPISAALLESQAGGIAHVRGWIDSFWHTSQDFLRLGFGHCVSDQESGQIVSWCLTVFAAGSERELGLATLPEFRGRGLAAQAAAACITQALAENIHLHWHCWVDNLPSSAIAEKLGFQHERDYSVYRFRTGAE